VNTYVISDIHGNNDSFQVALREIGLTRLDKLILLGDLIDRGNNSKGVLDTVLLLKYQKYDVTCLMRNHEKMMLDALSNNIEKHKWLANGGLETLSSFLTSDLQKIPSKYYELLKTFEYYFEWGEFLLVHAGIDTHVLEPLNDINSLIWIRNWQHNVNYDWLGSRRIIHGHTPMEKAVIVQQFSGDQSIYCIDNGSFLDSNGFGEICVLNLKDLTLSFHK